VDRNGTFNWGPAAAGGGDAELSRVTFRHASMTNGIVSLVDGVSDASLVLDHVDLTVTAGGLAGPYRITGSHGAERARLPFTISSGRVDTGAPTRVSGRLGLDPATEASFDGTLRGWNGTPHFSGSTRVTRTLSKPGAEPAELRAEAHAEIGPGGSDFTELTVVATDGDETSTATGDARIINDNGAPRVSLDLKARRLDFGALAADGNLAGQGIAAVLAEANGWLGESTLTGRLSLGVDGAVYGGELVRDVQAVFNIGAESLGIETFGATLPGQSEFGFSGGLVRGDAAGKLVGRLVLNTRDLRRLLEWSLPPARASIAALIPANHGRLSITGGFAAEPGSVEMTGVEGLLEGDSFSGDISFDVGEPGEAHADLAFDRLDLDRLIATTFDPLDLVTGAPPAAADEPALPALGLEIDARRVRWRGREARGASFVARLADRGLILERLALDDFAGAAVTADGEGRLAEGGLVGGINLGVRTANLPAAIDAFGLDIARSLGQGPSWASLVGEADLTGRLESLRRDGEWRVRGAVSGRIGGTDIDAELTGTAPPADVAAGRIAGHAVLASEDAGRLLAQLGVGGLPVSTPGEVGTLDVELAGTVEEGLAYTARASGLTAEASLAGRLRAAPLHLAGDLVARVGDIRHAAAGLGLRAGAGAAAATDLSAAIEVTDEGLVDVRDLAGSVAGSAVEGGVRIRLAGTPGAQLALKLDTLSLPWALAALFAGGDGEVSAASPPLPGALWSTGLIDTVALGGFPVAARAEIRRLELGRGLALDGARFEGGVGDGKLEIRELTGTLDGGGAVSASGRFRQTELSLELDGKVAAAGLPVADLLADGEGRPLLTGHGDIEAEVSASGRSLLSLVSSLAGEGRVTGASLDLPRLGTDRLMRRIAGAVDAAAARALIGQARGGATTLEIGPGALRAANGRITLGPLPVTAGALTGKLTGFVNLADGRIDQEIALTDPGGTHLDVIHAGEFGDLTREIELTGTAAGLVRWTEPASDGTASGGPDPEAGPPAGVIEERVFELPLTGGGGAG
jgi:hypothetical protein